MYIFKEKWGFWVPLGDLILIFCHVTYRTRIWGRENLQDNIQKAENFWGFCEKVPQNIIYKEANDAIFRYG